MRVMGVGALATLIGTGLLIGNRVREEWGFWNLNHGDINNANHALEFISRSESVGTFKRLFDVLMEWRPKIANANTGTKVFKLYHMAWPIGFKNAYVRVILEIMRQIMDDVGGRSEICCLGAYRGLIYAEGGVGAIDAMDRVAGILDCINMMTQKCNPSFVIALGMIADDPSYLLSIRNLARLQIESYNQRIRFKFMRDIDQKLIEDINSNSSAIRSAAIQRSAMIGTEDVVPALLDAYVDEVNAPCAGSVNLIKDSAIHKALRSIVERRGDAVAKKLIDTGFGPNVGGIKGYSAAMLCEIGLPE